jgi:hypothetical protein
MMPSCTLLEVRISSEKIICEVLCCLQNRNLMAPPIRFIQIVQNLPGTPVERGGGFSDQESRVRSASGIPRPVDSPT